MLRRLIHSPTRSPTLGAQPRRLLSATTTTSRPRVVSLRWAPRSAEEWYPPFRYISLYCASSSQLQVLALSLWDDYAANALWLDSSYPTTADPSKPGVSRGPCGTDTGKPADVEKNAASASVIYSNIRWGDIGSTYSGTPTGPSSTATSPGGSTTVSSTSTSSAPSGSQAAHYAQCGGTGWTGATTCVSPYTCTALNTCKQNLDPIILATDADLLFPDYSQCL
jgi:hypothetical protein